MEKKWYKLLADFLGHKAGEEIELDESIGKPLVEAGTAEEIDKSTSDIVASALDKARDQLKEQVATTVAEMVKETLGDLEATRDGNKVSVTFVKDRREDDPTGGFASLGHFANAVKAWDNGERSDDRLRLIVAGSEKAAVDGINEGVGEEGGILIPTQFAAGIWERAQTTSDLLGRVDTYPITGNTYTVNALKGDTRAAGVRHGGVRGYWTEESGQKTSSRPTWKKNILRLKKLCVLIYATDEQLEDSPFALEAYLTRLASKEINFLLGDSIINGNGVGKPQGVLQSPSLVTVAKETGQAATTLVVQNIIKMYSRLYGPSRKNAVWLVNQDIEPQLFMLVLNVGTGGVPVYLPAGGVSGAPFATLLGRPILPVEWCATLGTVGDIIFADMSQYMMIRKGSGIKAAVSIHLRFDYDETVFRFTYRTDGQSWWPAPLTPYKGTANTQSPFVALAART